MWSHYCFSMVDSAHTALLWAIKIQILVFVILFLSFCLLHAQKRPSESAFGQVWFNDFHGASLLTGQDLERLRPVGYCTASHSPAFPPAGVSSDRIGLVARFVFCFFFFFFVCNCFLENFWAWLVFFALESCKAASVLLLVSKQAKTCAGF